MNYTYIQLVIFFFRIPDFSSIQPLPNQTFPGYRTYSGLCLSLMTLPSSTSFQGNVNDNIILNTNELNQFEKSD